MMLQSLHAMDLGGMGRWSHRMARSGHHALKHATQDGPKADVDVVDEKDVVSVL